MAQAKATLEELKMFLEANSWEGIKHKHDRVCGFDSMDYYESIL